MLEPDCGVDCQKFLVLREGVLLEPGCASRRNFAANVNHRILSKEERMISNVSGSRGKNEVDPVKVAFIKGVPFSEKKIKPGVMCYIS